MNVKEMVEETLKSGITPLRLGFETVNYFDSKNKIVRSSFIIESLDLGVLTFDQYRYVARRGKKGEELIKRQFEKIFTNFNEITKKNRNLEVVTIKVFPKMLLSGSVAELLFSYFSKYPKVSPNKIAIEISADILFEDLELVKKRLEDIKQLGVIIIFFEVGDEFCPIFRLSNLQFDYAFIDEYIKTCLYSDENEKVAVSLLNYLQTLNVKTFVLNIDEEQIDKANKFQLSGYSLLPQTKEV